MLGEPYGGTPASYPHDSDEHHDEQSPSPYDDEMGGCSGTGCLIVIIIVAVIWLAMHFLIK